MNTKVIFNKKAEIHERQGEEALPTDNNYSFLKLRSRIITISPLMKEILEEARTPHTADELVRWVSKTKNCSYESINEAVRSFLKRMVKIGALVLEDEQTHPEAESNSLFEHLQSTMRFGNFRLLKKVGKNHKVAIYKCEHDENRGIFYAIKVLIDPGEKESFLKEFEILSTLPDHQNIRKCITTSVHNGIPYILFEYVDGRPMSDIVKEVSLEAKYSIAYQVMVAMDHLHDHKVLHGDIHASNFLVDAHHHVHLIDLGMGYYEYEQDVDHGGIARYMPPERIPYHNLNFSKKKGDYVSEVFQIGICLYHLFSGHYPFKGFLLKDLAHAIRHTDPLPLTSTPNGEIIPKPFADIIFKSLEKDPNARYHTVEDMLEAWVLATYRCEAELAEQF